MIAVVHGNTQTLNILFHGRCKQNFLHLLSSLGYALFSCPFKVEFFSLLVQGFLYSQNYSLQRSMHLPVLHILYDFQGTFNKGLGQVAILGGKIDWKFPSFDLVLENEPLMLLGKHCSPGFPPRMRTRAFGFLIPFTCFVLSSDFLKTSSNCCG